ncbi:uncharacterized protein LOC135834104 [Planococcus citri]|uniref:uncharacterized protein LOC135834104 n=1 Tax=Planococcus citri TaxID=170843 RepID=UPI0031F7F220
MITQQEITDLEGRLKNDINLAKSELKNDIKSELKNELKTQIKEELKEELKEDIKIEIIANLNADIKKDIKIYFDQLKLNMEDVLDKIESDAHDKFMDIVDENVKAVVDGAKMALNNTMKNVQVATVPTSGSDKIFIDLFYKNVTNFEQKNRFFPHKFLAQFTTPSVTQNIDPDNRRMLLASCVKIESTAWNEKVQKAKTFEELQEYFLDIFWDDNVKSAAVAAFEKEIPKHIVKIIDFIEYISNWYDTLLKTDTREKLIISKVYKKFPKCIKEHTNSEGLVNKESLMAKLETVKNMDTDDMTIIWDQEEDQSKININYRYHDRDNYRRNNYERRDYRREEPYNRDRRYQDNREERSKNYEDRSRNYDHQEDRQQNQEEDRNPRYLGRNYDPNYRRNRYRQYDQREPQGNPPPPRNDKPEGQKTDPKNAK